MPRRKHVSRWRLNVKAAMAARGISNRDLAKALGYGEVTVSRFTTGRVHGGPNLRAAVAGYLDLSMEALDTPPPEPTVLVLQHYYDDASVITTEGVRVVILDDHYAGAVGNVDDETSSVQARLQYAKDNLDEVLDLPALLREHGLAWLRDQLGDIQSELLPEELRP